MPTPSNNSIYAFHCIFPSETAVTHAMDHLVRMVFRITVPPHIPGDCCRCQDAIDLVEKNVTRAKVWKILTTLVADLDGAYVTGNKPIQPRRFSMTAA